MAVAQSIANALPGREFDWGELAEAAKAAMKTQNRFPADGWPFGVDINGTPAGLHPLNERAINAIDSMIFSGHESVFDDATNLYLSAVVQRWSQRLAEAREEALERSKDRDYVECVEVLMKYDGPVYSHIYSGGSHYLAMLVSRDQVKPGEVSPLGDEVAPGDTVALHKAVRVTESDVDDLKESRVTLYDIMSHKPWIGLASHGTHFVRQGLEGDTIEADQLPDQGEYLWEPDESNPSHSPC